jgi:DNA/RNA endonuclease YhcR with UshA esterase domain
MLETNDDEHLETNDDEHLETNDDEHLETNDDEHLETNDDKHLEINEELSLLPQIFELDDHIWIAIGYDISNSVLIEGDGGIIVIDTLSSYESSKKLLKDFKSISEKPIKTIVLTMINPDVIQGSRAFIDAGDGNVEIVIDDTILDNYYNEYGVDFTPTHPYPSKFSLDISGIKIDLYTSDRFYTDQTYISLPDFGGILIGDSKHGVSPYFLDMDYFQSIVD